MNTKLNFKHKVKNAKGEDGNDYLSDLLSSLLLAAPVKPPISGKYFAWGLELANSGVIEIDDVDKKGVIDFIENHDGLNVMGRHRLLEIFETPKDNLKKVS